jgi:hypothetical protein
VAPRADERAVGAQRGRGHVAQRGHGVVHVHVHQHHTRPERALQLTHAPGQVLRLEQVVPAPRPARGPYFRHRPCPPGPRRRAFKLTLRRRHAEPRRARLQAHRAATRGRRTRAPAGRQPAPGGAQGARPRRHAPQAEEERAGEAHLVVGHDVGPLPAHVLHVLEQRVALLALAHQDRAGVGLRRPASRGSARGGAPASCRAGRGCFGTGRRVRRQAPESRPASQSGRAPGRPGDWGRALAAAYAGRQTAHRSQAREGLHANTGADTGSARSAWRPARPRRRAGAGRCPRPPALSQQTRPGPPAPPRPAPRRARRARAARRPRCRCRLHAGRPTRSCRMGRSRRARPRGRRWRAPRPVRRARVGQRRSWRHACEQRGSF